MTHLAERARALVFPCLVAMMLLAPPEAIAQRVAGSVEPVLFSPGGGWTAFVYDLSTSRVVWTAPGDMVRGVLTSDGRYLLYWRSRTTGNGGVDLLLVDTETTTTQVIQADFEPWLPHPREPVVYGLTRKRTTGFGTSVGVLARLDVGGLHEIGGCPTDSTAALAITADGGTIAAVCESGDVAVIDVTTGSTRRVIPAGALPNAGVAVSGGAVVVVSASAGASDSAAVFDAATGASVAAVEFPPGGAITTQACRARIAGSAPDGRVIITCSVTTPSVPRPHTFWSTRFFDSSTATWSSPVGYAFAPYNPSVDPDGRILSATWVGDLAISIFQQTELQTGSTLSSYTGVSARAMAYAPLASTLGVAASGSRVDLSWTLPVHSPAATRYVLEIGTAPGLSNLGAIDLGALTSFTASGVPPGTYYVRLRGVNYAGTGAASNELRIDVQ